MLGVSEIDRCLEQWPMEVKDLRQRMILAPTPRERVRWYAVLLLAQGWTAAATAKTLERDRHTIGRWASAFGEGVPAALLFEQTGGSPLNLDQAQQEELKEAVQQPPASSGIGMANWYWQVVRRFASERLGIELSRSSCLSWIEQLGICLQAAQEAVNSRLMRPSGRLSCRRTPNPEGGAPHRPEAWIFFADDCSASGRTRNYGASGCCRASARFGGLDQPAVWGAGQLLFGRCAWRPVRWDRWNWRATAIAWTSVAFLKQLREKHPEPMRVIWDKAPDHRGEAVREYLRTLGLDLRLVNLPGYSPDFNSDEAVWGWAREEAIGQSLPGQQGGGAGKGPQLPGRACQPERRGEAPLPDGNPSRRAEALLPNSTRTIALSRREMHIGTCGLGLGRRRVL